MENGPLHEAPPNWASLVLQKHKSLCLLSLWTIKHFIVWLLGENKVISIVFQSVCWSIYSIFFFFSLSFSFLFSNTEREKIFLFSIFFKYIFFNYFNYIFYFFVNFSNSILLPSFHFIIFECIYFFKFSTDILFLPHFFSILSRPFHHPDQNTPRV